MTVNQFLAKWDRQPIDWDGYYGRQCVDVYHRYVNDVVGGGHPAVPGAKDIWNNYATDTFIRIPNTPAGVPIRGDVMIWGTKVGAYGHVGIVIDANVNSFTSFDQNWPFDNGTGVAHYQWHNYNGVLGWLRPRKDVNFDAVAAQAEADRIAQEQARIAREKAEALAKEQARLEAERKAQEAARLEAERKAEEARLEAERKEAERIEAERLAEEKRIADEKAEKNNIIQAIINLINQLFSWLGRKK